MDSGLQMPGNGIAVSNARCSFSRAACRCSFTTTVTLDESGTWRVEGTRLVDEATGDVQKLCVEGDTMRLIDQGSVLSLGRSG